MRGWDRWIEGHRYPSGAFIGKHARSLIFRDLLALVAELPEVTVFNVCLEVRGRKDPQLDAWNRLLNRIDRTLVESVCFKPASPRDPLGDGEKMKEPPEGGSSTFGLPPLKTSRMRRDNVSPRPEGVKVDDVGVSRTDCILRPIAAQAFLRRLIRTRKRGGPRVKNPEKTGSKLGANREKCGHHAGTRAFGTTILEPGKLL